MYRLKKTMLDFKTGLICFCHFLYTHFDSIASPNNADQPYTEELIQMLT